MGHVLYNENRVNYPSIGLTVSCFPANTKLSLKNLSQSWRVFSEAVNSSIPLGL
jgi:hypothetical protein